MTEKGRRRGVLLFLVIFPTCVLFAMTVWDGGFASAEGLDPPETGDWVIRGNTTLDSADIYAPGNIIIEANATLHIVNTTLTMNRSIDDQHTLLVENGAKLFVYGGSILNLDRFETEPLTTIELEDCEVRTRGEMLLWSKNIFADTVVLKNIAPNGGPGHDGRAALLILDGSIEGNLLNVDIQNYGGHAGLTSPGQNGSRGGNSILISNVSQWSECTIDCRAGDSSSGSYGIPGMPGGSGGPGANALVRMNCTKFVNTTIEAKASDGGMGASGSNNPIGDAGGGGDGAIGGNAYIAMEIQSSMEISYINVQAFGGNGGSAGSGGSASDGTAGDGGIGADGGSATIEISSKDDLEIDRTTLTTSGGDGGYGGDYGWHQGGSGQRGSPGTAGNGGPAIISVIGLRSVDLTHFRADSMAGSGLDGGAGYDQGETGGRGGDAEISVRAYETLNGKWVNMNAIGGQGGPGGPARSEIEGNGGDGGDALIEFTGLLDMIVENFSIYVNFGTGGHGRDLIYNGAEGIPTLDLDTQALWMAEGVLNMPLDDLHGDAVGVLYNVTFDMEFGIPVLPIGNAVATTWYPVTVHAVNHADPLRAKSLEGYKVTVISIDTGEVVAEGITDEYGKAYFDLPSARYTSVKVEYLGSYYFIVTSPDGKYSKTVRGEIRGPSVIRNIIAPPPPLYITIDQPVDEDEYRVNSREYPYLESFGIMLYSETVASVRVQLHPLDEGPAGWPWYDLGLRNTDWHDLPEDDRWGWFYPPEGFSNRWQYFYRFPMFEEEVEYHNGSWRFVIEISTEDERNRSSSVDFDLLLDLNIARPSIFQFTLINGRTFNGSSELIEGVATDDYQIVAVEVRVDGGDWMPAIGTYEWTYLLETRELLDGEHTIEFRAYDGEHYSEVVNNTFFVEKFQLPDVTGTEGISWNLYYLILAGVSLLAVGVVLILVMLVMKRRKPPDS